MSYLDELAAELYLPTVAESVRTSQTFVVPQGTLHALRWYNEKPVQRLYLHGVGLNATTWDSTELYDPKPALMLDLPGHGDSSWRDDGDYRPHILAQDVAYAITVSHVLTKQTDIIGQSLGGITALYFALLQPQLCRSITLIDIGPIPDEIVKANSLQDFFMNHNDFHSVEEVVNYALSFGFGPTRTAVERAVMLNTYTDEHGIVHWKHHIAAQGGKIPFIGTYQTIEQLFDPVTEAHIPLNVIGTSRGLMTRERLENLASTHELSQWDVIDSEHNIQKDNPKQLAHVLDAFVG